MSREIPMDGNTEDMRFKSGIHLGMRAASLTFLTRGGTPDLRAATFEFRGEGNADRAV
ncbi:MAG: hypothetical protein WA603_12765 [Candidatus Acidiferrales bacterium]